tara:strand:- start:5547 stop:6377 length:831 start_codon:yes stop_codon:yes gene_type:complete
MTEPLLIIYSHSEYEDILDIATSHLSQYKNKVLLINDQYKSDRYVNDYLDIIKYNDVEPYASRLLKLNEIDEEYILFMHETDILIKYDIDVINNMKIYMKNQDIDKIELQHCAWPPADMPLKQTYNMKNKEIYFNDVCNLYKIDNPKFFVYNVNPTLWKKKSLLNIMYNFREYNYRDIEADAVQKYTSDNFVCMSLKCCKYVKCAYFTCPPFFQFIHITHYGKFAQIKKKFYDNKNFKHINNTYLLDNEIYDHYIKKIYEPYIKNSKRQIRNSFPL